MEVKETQAHLLSLLKDFNTLCKANDINYSLHGGTMLGAIREHGFIPWDDDLDITMTRVEYNKLASVINKYPDYHLVGKIKKQFQPKNDKRFWIDIFICDYISEKPNEQKKKLNLLSVLDIANRDAESIKLSNLDKYSFLKRVAFKTIYCIGHLFPKNIKVNKYLQVSEKKWIGNKTLMIRSNDQYVGRKIIFPACWYDGYVDVDFDNIKVPVIKAYHECLVTSYGEDYMTPIKYDHNEEIHNMLRSSDVNL